MYGAYDTITVWNRYRNPATRKDEWYRHVIPRASWECKVVKSIVGTDAVVGSTYTVLVDVNPRFKPRREWEDLSQADKLAYFTLTPGELVAHGDIARDITGEAGHTESDIKKACTPDIFTIKAVADMTQGYKMGRHFELVGV